VPAGRGGAPGKVEIVTGDASLLLYTLHNLSNYQFEFSTSAIISFISLKGKASCSVWIMMKI